MNTVINVKNLGKYYGNIKAVDDISFEVNKGEVLGFLGPNGAGKSTTMKMLTCFVTPDFGSATINGFDILKDSLAVRTHLGYLPESAPAYEDMTVKSFLDFIADIRGLTGEKKVKRLKEVYDIVGIGEVLQQSILTLSKGYKRRVGLAQAIVHDPKVLILDEPTDGLDPNQKYEVRKLIKSMAEDKVIILSTHILEEVDEVCTRAIIIAKGKIVADGTPDTLRRESSWHGLIEITLGSNDCDKAKETFNSLDWVQDVKFDSNENTNSFLIQPKESQNNSLETVISTCQHNKWPIEHIHVHQGQLAEVFRQITQ